MPDWRQEALAFAAAAERRLRHGINRVERAFDRDAYAPVGYRGYGTREKALVLGRVLQADELSPLRPSGSGGQAGGGSRLRNLAAALTRLESDPMPHARVRVS